MIVQISPLLFRTTSINTDTECLLKKTRYIDRRSRVHSENWNVLFVHVNGILDFSKFSRGGEMGENSPPFSEPPSFFSFSYPSNIEIIFDFSDIITKIHPPFQNPGSAFGWGKYSSMFAEPEVNNCFSIIFWGEYQRWQFYL